MWGWRQANQVGGKKKKKLGYGDPGKSHQEVGVTELGSGEPERASELWRGHTHVDDDWLYTGAQEAASAYHTLAFLVPSLASLPMFTPNLPGTFRALSRLTALPLLFSLLEKREKQTLLALANVPGTVQALRICLLI